MMNIVINLSLIVLAFSLITISVIMLMDRRNLEKEIRLNNDKISLLDTWIEDIAKILDGQSKLFSSINTYANYTYETGTDIRDELELLNKGNNLMKAQYKSLDQELLDLNDRYSSCYEQYRSIADDLIQIKTMLVPAIMMHAKYRVLVEALPIAEVDISEILVAVEMYKAYENRRWFNESHAWERAKVIEAILTGNMNRVVDIDTELVLKYPETEGGEK